jgi:hypothetical protein
MSDDFEVVGRSVTDAFLGIEQTPPLDVPVDPAVIDSAPGVYELPDASPLTNFRPRWNPGRLQVLRRDQALTLYARRGPWKDGCPLLPSDPDDPEHLIAAPGDRPSTPVILVRDADGRVSGLRLPQLVEMVRNPEIEPWIEV